MNKLIIAICLIVLGGCGENNNNVDNIKDGHYEYSGGVWVSLEYKIEQKTIDSCEYIVIFGKDSRNIIHKQNCKYCLKRK